MKFIAVALPALFLASAASAQLDASSSGSAVEPGTRTEQSESDSAEASANDDRQICRRIETNTGSRVPHRRVCMTEREWRAFNRQN